MPVRVRTIEYKFDHYACWTVLRPANLLDSINSSYTRVQQRYSVTAVAVISSIPWRVLDLTPGVPEPGPWVNATQSVSP